MESILERDRLVVAAGLAGIALLAWWYMWHEARLMGQTGICRCLGMKMSGPDIRPWSASELLPLFLMWAEMMVAMMVPSVAPAVLTFAAVSRKRREQQRPFVPAAVFLAGYLTVWTTFSAMAALAQWIFHSGALLSPTMVMTSPVVGGMLLIAAGVFQFGGLKARCLEQCRSPLNFLFTDWREGWSGAFMMGVKHGAYCTGCCWFLMALLFVAGVMNIWWVALISALVLVEKVAPKGLWLGRIAGVFLAVWGVWMIVLR